MAPSWISDRNDFSYFFVSTSHPDASYQFSNKLALWFRKISEKKSFKMAAMTAILDFRSKQVKLVTRMFPTKFRVNWPFSSGEEAKNRF